MSKYHARRTTVDGIRFDSGKEARRYAELKLLERAGEIEDLELQHPFILIPKSAHGREVRYIADFVYRDLHSGKWVVEDVKGVKTPVYLLKKRILAELGVEITET